MSNTVQTYTSRIAPEHRNSPKFMAVITAHAQAAVDLQNAMLAIQQAFDLDQAIGVQLDQVGQWIGRTRDISTPLPNSYFSWDTPGQGWDQAFWKGPYSPEEGVTVLDDTTYRMLLKAKAAANGWDGSLQMALTLFQSTIVLSVIQSDTLPMLIDNQDGSMTIAIAGTLPGSLAQALIMGSYVPLKPEGIICNYIVTSVDGAPLFGFDLNSEYISGWDIGAWGTPIIV